MARTLIVAEKPSVARDIARVLGATQKGEGCLCSGEYVVTWAIGHLARLAEPDELDAAYKRWSLEQLPILPKEIPLKAISKTRTQLMLVRRLLKDQDTDNVICATDAGREGELIFRWLYQLSGAKKPFRRLWISSMTDEAIKEGMANLKSSAEYDALYQSAVCRAKADWLIGMNLSRAFTVKYDALLSVGRVQTPTLSLLVKRQRQIDDFTPETYYQVKADFGEYQGLWIKRDEKPTLSASPINKREDAETIVERVKGKTGKVVKSEQQEKKELPPQLYDLTTLQREANTQFGFSAKKTLSLAQDLYEKHKLITYPRTEARALPMDVKPQVLSVLHKLPAPLNTLAPTALQSAEAMGLGRVFVKDVGADHHAIIPTKKTIDLDKLTPDEKKLMELIVKRLLAAFYPPYRYTARTVITEVADDRFKSTGKTIVDMGWRAVEAPKTKEKQDTLPSVSVGDEHPVKKADLLEKQTTPPSPYTDGTLLYAMENAGREVNDETLRETMRGHGLGTPATRAAIIERLLTVGYAQRQGKAIVPTEKGKQLIMVMPSEIASAEMTGKWEYALDLIAKTRPVDKAFVGRFMQGIEKLTSEIVSQVKTGESTIHIEDKARGRRGRTRRARPETLEGVVCPICQKGGVTESEKAFGCTQWRNGCPFTLWKDALKRYSGPELNKKLVTLLLRDKTVRGSTGTITLSGEAIRFYYAASTEVSPPVSIRYQKSAKK